jgi:hypothetical protein
MTTFLRISFLSVFLAGCFFGNAVAQGGAVWTEVPWRIDRRVTLDVMDKVIVVPPAKNLIAGVSPSIAEIIADVRRSKSAGTPLSRKDVADALSKAAEGKEGPLLVVSDGTKMRIMELRPKEGLVSAP